MKLGIFYIIGLVLLTDICDTISQLFLKSSINSIDLHINTFKKALELVIRLAKIPVVWLGFVFSGISLCIWLFVLTRADLNFAYSVDSMRYILITLASMAILKEKIGTIRWFGIIAVVSGIMLVVLG